MQQLSAKVCKLIFEYLHINWPKSDDFLQNNGTIASRMSCQIENIETLFSIAKTSKIFVHHLTVLVVES